MLSVHIRTNRSIIPKSSGTVVDKNVVIEEELNNEDAKKEEDNEPEVKIKSDPAKNTKRFG